MTAVTPNNFHTFQLPLFQPTLYSGMYSPPSSNDKQLNTPSPIPAFKHYYTFLELLSMFTLYWIVKRNIAETGMDKGVC